MLDWQTMLCAIAERPTHLRWPQIVHRACLLMDPCEVLIPQATQVKLHDVEPAVAQAILQAEYVSAIP